MSDDAQPGSSLFEGDAAYEAHIRADEEKRLRMVPCENCDGVGEVQFSATSKWGDPTPDGGLCPICGGYGFDYEEDKGDDHAARLY